MILRDLTWSGYLLADNQQWNEEALQPKKQQTLETGVREVT